jgi:competence protein ComFC
MVFEFIKDILFPPSCLGCGKIGIYICYDCVRDLSVVKNNICPYCRKQNIYGFTHPVCERQFGLDGLLSIFDYLKPLNKIIKNIKYQYVRDAIPEIVNIIPEDKIKQIDFIKKINKKTIIIPIPLYKQRLNQRGYDHVLEIAKSVNKLIGLEIFPHILLKVKNTLPQARLKNNKQRFNNIRGAFAVENNFKKYIEKKNIILFDDIWTSGFTMKEAARVLKLNSATNVYGLTIAR